MLAIKPIFKDLSNSILLKKCVHGRTQDPNESLTSVIWTQLPKNVFVGRETLNIGVADAVIAFNTGNLGRVNILEELCGSAGGNCVITLKSLDKRRQNKSQLADEALAKKASQKVNGRRKKEDESDGDKVLYGPGIDEIE